jgi:hypothetical protein
MAGHWKKWWSLLINQAFFAPAFLFMFYLVATLINSKFVQNVIKASDKAPAAEIVGIDLGSTIIVIFHFIIIGGLMIGSLIIAKQMGAWGADTMMDWGKKARGWAQGYVGRGVRYFPSKGAGWAGSKAYGGAKSGAKFTGRQISKHFTARNDELPDNVIPFPSPQKPKK